MAWVKNMGMGQNLVPLVNIKIAGKWMFIPLKMVSIGIDPYPYQNEHLKSLGWELLTFQPRLQIPEISSGLPMRNGTITFGVPRDMSNGWMLGNSQVRSCKRCKPSRNLVLYVKIVGPSSWVNVPKQSSFHSSTKLSHVGSTSLFKHPKVMILSPKAQKTGPPCSCCSAVHLLGFLLLTPIHPMKKTHQSWSRELRDFRRLPAWQHPFRFP